jgi:hypothetical protein
MSDAIDRDTIDGYLDNDQSHFENIRRGLPHFHELWPRLHTLNEMSRAMANRYRDLLSGMFRRAIRLGHVAGNPVNAVQKFKESGGRIAYLTAEQEAAIFEACRSSCGPYSSPA